MTALSQILQEKIVAIIRGVNPGDVLKVAGALQRGGVKLIEVTMNSDDALRVIEEISDTMKNKMLVGAGTVLDAASAKSAIQAGAKFIISPNTNIEVISATKEQGVVSIPGAFTPTEIVSAYAMGGDIIKVFPSLGVAYIRDLRAPLDHIPLMPTGGINLENIDEFKKTGAVAFGIGNALVNSKNKVTEEYLTQITDTASKFVKTISGSD